MARSGIMAFTAKLERQYDRVEEVMAGVVLTRATMLSPKDTGTLRSTGRVEKNPQGGRSVIFGDENVRYARRRHYENKKNPQTLHYLERAGDSVKKEGAKKYIEMSKI